jgi:hypothetical protein
MTAARRTWVDQMSDVFVDELDTFGLVMSRDAVVEALRAQVTRVAKVLGVTDQSARRYVTEELVRGIARSTAVALADEQPGADLWSAPRNIPIPIAVLGRSITALAESGRVRSQLDDATGLNDSLGLISLLGSFLSRQPHEEGSVHVPQAALTRSARFLEATAALTRERAGAAAESSQSDSRLADAFDDDACALRLLVSAYGFSSEQATPG